MQLIAVSLIIVVSLIVVLSVDWVSHRKLSYLKIEGNQFIPQEVFRSLIPDSLYKSEKGKIKLNGIRQIVLKYPFVKSANARFGSNNDVVLELTLRHPVIQIVDSSGILMFADEEKKILPYLFFENFSHLPVIRNIHKGGKIDSSALNFYVNLIMMLRQEKYALVYGLISEVVNSNKIAFSANLTIDNARVDFGDTSNLLVKFDNLNSYLNYYYKNVQNSKIDYIDLRWSRQVIVKLN